MNCNFNSIVRARLRPLRLRSLGSRRDPDGLDHTRLP